MEFTDAHKQEYQRRFPFGVNKVKIVSFQLDKTEDGKEFVEAFFCNEAGDLEDSGRLWFTTDKAAQFSFNTLRDILVHNTSDENKDKARAAMASTPNTTAMVELLMSKLVGKDMWMTKYFDPKRTYEANGQTYRSVNTNFYGYEPELRPELMPTPKGEQTMDAADEVKEVFPGATETTPVDPTNTWGN